jgi:IMP cyclohydrolase
MNAEVMIALAQRNFLALSLNPYPGRGIVAGLSETGEYMVQVYWIMGRSENSRNRVFKVEDETGRLYTEAADPSKVKDPSLIIYNAMREEVPFYVVSNGDQTDTVVAGLYEGGAFYLNEVLHNRQYEPDGPNFTQRITAVSQLTRVGQRTCMSILRKSEFGGRCDHITYELHPGPGFGYCITTYSGDGNPLPSFRGDPLLMPLMGGPENIAQAYWDALNEDNRVSLAVKWIDISNGGSDILIINKYAQS